MTSNEILHTDHLGTPQVMTDNTQAVVWAADYKPFGEATMTTELVTNNLRFPGQYYDQESGLSYNYFRDYNPSTGRYVESDPSGIRGGINLYIYANANPLVSIDPKGLVTWTGSVWVGTGKVGKKVGKIPLKVGKIFVDLELESECINHKKVVASLTVENIKSHDNLHFPTEVFYAHVELDDHLPTPSAYGLQGDFELGTFGIVIGTGYLRTGMAYGTFIPGGLLFGGITLTGESKLRYTWPRIKDCECED